MKEKQTLLNYYPIAVKLSDKSTVVIGGGKVAERKVRALLESGAKIRLISPTATGYLRGLARQKRIKWAKRRFRGKDIAGADIVIAATDSECVNKKVSRYARRRRTWVNAVDKKESSDFISPAVFRAGSSIITVYTDGNDPALSSDLRKFIKEYWNDFISYRHKLQDNPA